MNDSPTGDIADAVEDLLTWARRRRIPSDLSATALTTLDRLAYAGPGRVSDLATLEQVTQPGMTGLVNRLVDEGLVIRAADPADGRASLVSITPAGRTRVYAHRSARAAAVEPALARLSEREFALLLAALPAIRALTAQDAPTRPSVQPILETSSRS